MQTLFTRSMFVVAATTCTTTITSSSSLWFAYGFRPAAATSAFITSRSSIARAIPNNAKTTTTTTTLLATNVPECSSKQEYEAHLDTIGALPKGFATGTAKGTFVPEDVPSMGELNVEGTVIHLTQGPTDSWAATFTKNKFPGAPILIGKSMLASGGPLQAIAINNKVSNVCSGGDGVADSKRVCDAVAEALGIDKGGSVVLPSSTGVIGWRLPAQVLARDVFPRAVASLQSESAVHAAKSIMTTDRYPKVRSVELSSGARIVGIAKGAGMIEPNMATMLSYIMTDAIVSKETLQSILSEAVDQSFNSISVDGDESTSDTAVLVSSNMVETPDADEFKAGVLDVCRGLAGDLVRNGEGTGHVIRVEINNYPGTDYEARSLGRKIVNSPLFKCAIKGNDPNTGRLASAIGSFMGRLQHDPVGTTLTLGGRTIFSDGKFVLDGGDEVEDELSNHIKQAEFGDREDFPRHQRYVQVGVEFSSSSDGGGGGNAIVLGSDLSAEYVSINADYRS